MLISEAFPPERRARAIGIWGSITGMAVTVAPLVGGAIVSGLAWRWIFWVNVPIGVAVLAAGLTRLARSPKVSARIDLVGMLLGAVHRRRHRLCRPGRPTIGWTSAQVLTAGIGGLLLASPTHQRHGVGGSVHAVNRRPKAARIIRPSRVSLA